MALREPLQRISDRKAIKENGELDLPEFTSFYGHERFADVIGVKRHENQVALHKCILVSRTSYFDLDTDSISLTGELI